MALHTEEVQEMSSGFTKTIEASAMGLIMQNLQRDQYQFPIKSTVREIVCNGIDSIADRNAAMDILKGAPISKYFQEDKAGALFQDSSFNADYYDPAWLSGDNQAYIKYTEGAQLGKDYITFSDNGTGLGGKRLEGYFSLGFSSKRLSKITLGKFGIGAKAALSVGVQYFTMESRYNGCLYRFNVYSSKVDSIIPAFNMETGEPNGHTMFGTYKVYFEATTLKNGVSVTVETKKHHKAQYIDAVKSQLLYFPDIDFRVENSHGLVEHIAYRAGILYEDEYIVLSDNNQWSRPHLLLNKVNYGFINWEELELEPKFGNVGIKVQPEEVDVNPSRESIIWSDSTKMKVQARFKDVVGIATDFVQKQLQEDDFVKWLRTCYQISSASMGGNSSIVSRLAGIIDISQVEPYFPPDKDIRFHPSRMWEGYNVRAYSMSRRTKANATLNKVERLQVYTLTQYSALPIFLMDESTSVRRDKYMLQKLYPGGFITIKAPEWIDTEFGDDLVIDNALVTQLELTDTTKVLTEKEKKSWAQVISSVPTIWKYLNKSTETKLYSSVIVPEGFTATEDDEDEEIAQEDAVKVAAAKVDADARRKLEGKTVLHTPEYLCRQNSGGAEKPYTYYKIEVPIAEISDWDQEEIFYCNDAEAEMMQLAAFITRPPNRDLTVPRSAWFKSSTYSETNPLTHYTDNDRLRLVKVSQPNTKLYSSFKPITKFFIDVKQGTLTMSNALLRWNTARLMQQKLGQAAFLWNFSTFDAVRSAQYQQLVEYVKTSYNEVGNHAGFKYGVTDESYKQLIAHLDNVLEFQHLVAGGASDEEIAERAKAMYNNTQVTDAMAVEPEIWALFIEVLEYAVPIQTMLNTMPLLTGVVEGDLMEPSTKWDQFEDRVNPLICAEVEQAIFAYLQFKGVS